MEGEPRRRRRRESSLEGFRKKRKSIHIPL
jgi:hypothetical protein